VIAIRAEPARAAQHLEPERPPLRLRVAQHAVEGFGVERSRLVFVALSFQK
jgi:hypothetical protein